MMLLLSWLIRYGHVLGAAVWVGGYAIMAFLIIPLIGKGASEGKGSRDLHIQLAITAVRFFTYTGTLTMGFGIVLITFTRGFASLFGSLWGSLIITGFVLAVVLLGIGDGALRPAIRKIDKIGDAPARRWAMIGFVLTVLAVGVMTGATFFR
jgi:putative copper export protein